MWYHETTRSETRRGRGIGERGFALPAVILVVMIFVALGLFGIALARQEQQTAFRVGSRASAFYAAELGLSRGLDRWGELRAGATPAGDTITLDTGSGNGGVTYTVEAIRLDDGTAANPLFMIESEGVARDGRTQRVGLLAASVPIDLDLKGAVQVKGGLRLQGTTDVSGTDAAPPGWSDCPPSANMPGVVMADTTELSTAGDASYDGDPPLVQDQDTTGLFQFGEMSFDELAAEANITLPDGHHISSTDPAPALTPQGACDTGVMSNWGDPMNPDQSCGNYFPVIHAAGDLKLSGSGAGQGILLVDGDLDVSGGVEFFGPVIVKGMVKSTGGGFHFHGGLVAGSTDLKDETTLSGSTRIQNSSCAVQRALTQSAAARAKRLTDRAWFRTR